MLAGNERGVIETAKAIARIEERDGLINAVVVRDFDRALMAARAADEANTAGEAQPLLGVPLSMTGPMRPVDRRYCARA